MARGNEGKRVKYAGGESKAAGKGFETIDSWDLFLSPQYGN
jgi:hypothetical protein